MFKVFYETFDMEYESELTFNSLLEADEHVKYLYSFGYVTKAWVIQS